MQATSAFVTVQIAFNWVVDNYPRLAEWTRRRAGSVAPGVAQPLDAPTSRAGAAASRAAETDRRALR